MLNLWIPKESRRFGRVSAFLTTAANCAAMSGSYVPLELLVGRSLLAADI